MIAELFRPPCERPLSAQPCRIHAPKTLILLGPRDELGRPGSSIFGSEAATRGRMATPPARLHWTEPSGGLFAPGYPVPPVEPLGAAAFDGVDRHGRIGPDGSEMRGDSVENKQVELIMSDRWFR
jgi:hypothetical protein